MAAAMIRVRASALPLAGTAVIVAAGTAALLILGFGGDSLVLGGLAVLGAAALLIDVDLPRGGSVPMGQALVLAAVELLPWGSFTLVCALALGCAYPLAHRREGPSSALFRIGATGIAAGAAALVHMLARALPLDHVDPEVATLGRLVVAGAAFFAADILTRRRLRARLGAGTLPALAVYATMLSAAALLAIGYRHSPWWALIAAVPLVVTRFSFRRYTEARETYTQTIEALSLLPEVAGHAPLGHGLRTAYYAGALAEALRLDGDRSQAVQTAARLHHIGHVSLHEAEERPGPPDPSELATTAGDILRETGFLAPVAGLVEEVWTGGSGLEAAIIRVASTLDELTTAADPPPDPFLATLERHPVGADRTVAIALLRQHEVRPHLVAEARAAAALLVGAAGADREPGHGHDHDPDHDCR